MVTAGPQSAAGPAGGEITISDKTVSRPAFGAMRLADSRIWGVVEDILREALHPYPRPLLVVTKVGQVQPRPGEWVPIGHHAFLRHQCELSLRRLGVDMIDLLYLHRVNPQVPFADQVGTMRELQQEGKIAHFGLSEVRVEQIEAARQIIDVAAVQNIYNLMTRTWDEVVDYCERRRRGRSGNRYVLARPPRRERRGRIAATDRRTDHQAYRSMNRDCLTLWKAYP